jgi:hypothetical protein
VKASVCGEIDLKGRKIKPLPVKAVLTEQAAKRSTLVTRHSMPDFEHPLQGAGFKADKSILLHETCRLSYIFKLIFLSS